LGNCFQGDEDTDLAALSSTDIIMDVARAADPERVDAARERLSAMAAGRAAPAEFAATGQTTGSFRAAAPPRGTEAFERFEAFVLQSFLENMMPDDMDSVYGGGLAGGMWKSMMAEQLANQMAKAGGIGIADRILTDYYSRGEEKGALDAAAADFHKRDAETRNLTSQAIVHEIQRRIGDALGQDQLLTERKQG
jgi:peptidoglycan hydrolase FlgJ